MMEYDAFAEDYTKFNNRRPLKKFAVYPSFFNELKDINGKKILDLACGDGLIAREMKKRGAEEVIGIDESKEMIRMAIDKEANMPLGINYKIGKVGELGKIGEFDIITGSFLLHYSKSKNELRNMLKDIYINLKEGGIFLGINNNPEHPLCSDEKYGNLIKSTLPLNLTSPLDSGSH